MRRAEWVVADADLTVAQDMVRRLHYAQGGSNTAVAVHGLYRADEPDKCLGVAWWLPPTRVAAESVHPDWKRVISLTRLAIEPEVPTNGASFLLGKSVRLLRASGRWAALVTYADESQGHLGNIYRASNWTYVGRTGPYPRWVDQSGRQVSPKSTVNRTKAQMLALGHSRVGSFYKHKFVMIFDQPAAMRAAA